MNKRKNNQYNKVRIKAEEDLSHEEDDFDDQSPSTSTFCFRKEREKEDIKIASLFSRKSLLA